MLKARGGRHHARSSWSARIAAGPAALPCRLPHQLRPLALDRLAREHRAVAGDLPAPEGRRPHLPASPCEQFYDPLKGMFLPDRYIKGECPNCHSKDQYGDACEVCGIVYAPTDLINPYSTLSGAKPVLRTSEHFFFRLSDPRCVAFLEQWLERAGTAAARRWSTRRASGSTAAASRRSATGTSRAMRPTSAFAIPGCARQVLLRVARCADRLPRRAEELLRQRQGARERRAAQLRGVPRRPRHRADPLHRQGHHLLPHAVLAGDAEVRRRAVQGARPRVRARLHHRLGREDVQVARHRHQPAALPRDRHERRVAALLHRRQAQRATSRTSTSTPRTSSRGSTATSSASTSTSPAAPQASSTASSPARCTTSGDTAALTAEARTLCAAVHTSYEAREFGKAMREVMALRRSHQPGLRCPPALGARQGPGAGGASCRTCARARCMASRCSRCCSPRCCRRSTTRAAQELFGLDDGFLWGDVDGAAAAHPSLQASDEPRRARSSSMRCSSAASRAAPRHASRHGGRPRARRSRSMSSSAWTCAWRASSTRNRSRVPTSS